MKNDKSYNYLDQYLSEVQGKGALTFTLEELLQRFSNQSEYAIKLALNRLTKKKKVTSVYKGFYVIIPPEYQSRKILPLELFVDPLFKYLGRFYYLGLLSSAAFHGASHQLVMESFVIINKPPIRATKVESLKVNYVVKSDLPKYGLEKRKTDTGYINISGAELTAVDLIEYQHRIGGLNRAATVLYELSESMHPGKLKEVLKNDTALSVLQRLGYVFDVVLKKKLLAKVISEYLADREIFRVPLKQGMKKNGFKVHPGWKVIENYKIETDFG